jgi:hypothetical protein
MSLAMYASEFNNENMENNLIKKKRENMRNKTLKRRDPVKSNANIDALKKRIQYDDGEDDDDESNLSNFQPLQHPNSAGMERMSNSNSIPDNTEYIMSEGMNAKQHLPYGQNDQNQQQEQQQEGFTQLPSDIINNMYPILIKVLMIIVQMVLIKMNY